MDFKFPLSELIENFQIPILRELKGVGKNFRDHGAVILRFTVNNPDTSLLQRLDEEDVQEEIMKYQETNRKGFFTRMDVGPQAFIVSSRAKADGQLHWPDLQIVFVQQPVIGKGLSQTTSLQIILNRMKSSGEIGFNTTAYLNGDRDDLKLALIDFRLFSDSSDVDALIEGKGGQAGTSSCLRFPTVYLMCSDNRMETRSAEKRRRYINMATIL